MAASLVSVSSAPAAAEDAYTWDNVEVVGGGFIPGVVFNESEPDLIYARTDIGGAYRWDPAAEEWVPLLDWVGWDDWGYSGVAALATDAVDPDRVYAAVGTYTNDWDPNNGAVLRSADRGETWETTELPFKIGGNMPGRGIERLSIDPNDNSVLYLGAPSGEGLWRSTDYGATWAEVTAFPNAGNYVQDPSDTSGYLSDNLGVTWVAFDPASGGAGQRTQDIYVGVADKENTVYRSTDAGETWERVPGQPTGHLAIEGVLDHENGHLYISTSDTGGPYDGAEGDVWRLDTATDEWTRISPVPSESEDSHYGYGGLAIDRQNPGTLMVATQISWWPDIQIFRTTDGGATWTQAWEYTNYPERANRYEMDISASPWLTFGTDPEPPEMTPKLGWMTQALEIDPFDSDRMLYGTGATLYGTDDLTAWDRDETFTIEVKARGIEETAVLDLAAPPDGAPLLSALGDVGGFRHDDLAAAPDLMYTQPTHGSTNSLDFAELAPERVVRAGSGDEGVARIGLSSDGGDTWRAGQEPGGVTGPGTVAMGADGSRVVWSPDGAGVHVSTDSGSSWTASSGVPAGARVEADRVNPQVFYAFSGGAFYTSTDGGATFTESAAAGLPAQGDVRFAAVPGQEGGVWLAGSGDGSGMWRSTDAGATFTPVEEVDEGGSVGFGAPAPGADHPAVYTSSMIDGVRGIFRSDDAGATWTRINDDQHQWAWTGAAITGDPDVYGRVYVSTNGRGIVYGDPA
ncbi:WD40/YVTN/BNR-like repeat-containing protein [Nocardiopsis sediminis]|uniref:WD40/YVTN/BNR-like repeat-containing protein n=1 Tax=Nocardiopsis sediminis TaxID=1778267 RepID=A0ABV8FV76_9ACTN